MARENTKERYPMSMLEQLATLIMAKLHLLLHLQKYVLKFMAVKQSHLMVSIMLLKKESVVLLLQHHTLSMFQQQDTMRT